LANNQKYVLINLDKYSKLCYKYSLPLPGGVKEIKLMKHDHSNSVQRLKTIEGHIRGIQRMLENDQYCIDIIRQIQAVQSALTKVSAQILDGHLNTCLTTAVQGDEPEERQRVLTEITEIFQAKNQI
jgi:DNA-binding FrmR family transcriptional regulator